MWLRSGKEKILPYSRLSRRKICDLRGVRRDRNVLRNLSNAVLSKTRKIIKDINEEFLLARWGGEDSY